jgi:tripartite-type tricarboxylate transporter receptor subunit TctC
VRSDNWYGLIAPAGLRAEVEAKLRKAAIKTLRSAELKKQFETQDALPSPSTPEEFTAFVKGGGPNGNRCRRYQARLR